MARPLRVEHPGALYHVSCRGGGVYHRISYRDGDAPGEVDCRDGGKWLADCGAVSLGVRSL
jgi:hypothetical protein